MKLQKKNLKMMNVSPVNQEKLKYQLDKSSNHLKKW